MKKALAALAAFAALTVAVPAADAATAPPLAPGIPGTHSVFPRQQCYPLPRYLGGGIACRLEAPTLRTQVSPVRTGPVLR